VAKFRAILKLGQKLSKLVIWTIFVQVHDLDGVKVGISEGHTEEKTWTKIIQVTNVDNFCPSS
jgi:hypothetical protein